MSPLYLDDDMVAKSTLATFVSLVVNEDEGRRVEFQGPFHDFAGVDRDMIDSASRHFLVGDQNVLAVEVERAEGFDRSMRHGGADIVEQRIPA